MMDDSKKKDDYNVEFADEFTAAIFLILRKFLRFYLVICPKSSIFALEFDKNSMDL